MEKAPSSLKVCFPFENKSVGGSYHATRLLIDCFDPKDVRPLVVTHQQGPWSEFLAELYWDQHVALDISSPFSRPGFTRTIYDFVKCSLSLGRFLRRQRIDIVHTNEDSTALAWSMACKFSGKVHVWHQHAVPTASRSTRILRNRATVLLSASSYIGEELARTGRVPDLKLDNPFVFEGGTDGAPNSKKRNWISTGKSEGKISLIFVGSLTNQKRPKQAIEVISQLKQNGIVNIELNIFGDDRENLLAELESYASELGVLENVKFMGVQKNLASYYQAADFLIAPAVQEGFGRVLVEAMYYGCCVVAADSGGHKEVIESGHTGYLVRPDSPQDMTMTIMSCMSNFERKKEVIENAKMEALKRIDYNSKLNDLIDIYRRSIDGHICN